MKYVGLIKRMICEQWKQTTAGEGVKSLNEKPMTDYMNIAIQCSLQIPTNTPTPTCPTTIKCKESFSFPTSYSIFVYSCQLFPRARQPGHA